MLFGSVLRSPSPWAPPRHVYVMSHAERLSASERAKTTKPIGSQSTSVMAL